MTPTRLMFDLFHGDRLGSPNYTGDMALFSRAIVGGFPFLIHKLTQGTSFVDPLALGRLKAAAAAGTMVGGYHFMTDDDVMPQVANFMRAVGMAKGAVGQVPFVIALDNEPDPTNLYYAVNASVATDVAAQAFEEAILMTTGKRMLVYGNKYNFFSANSVGPMAACPLWLAEYGITPVCPPGWANWAWHQYSDGSVGPNPVNIPGIGSVDQSEFAGSLDEAKAWWQANGI